MRRIATRTTAGAALAAFALLLGGCGTTALKWSADRHTYESTTYRPWSVTLLDTRTGEPLWAVDVPVGTKLVVGFSEGTGPNPERPDEVVWDMVPMGRSIGTLSNRIPAPPAHARRLDAVLRPVPEYVEAPLPGAPFHGEPDVINPAYR